jgi:hypothetical protein
VPTSSTTYLGSPPCYEYQRPKMKTMRQGHKRHQHRLNSPPFLLALVDHYRSPSTSRHPFSDTSGQVARFTDRYVWRSSSSRWIFVEDEWRTNGGYGSSECYFWDLGPTLWIWFVMLPSSLLRVTASSCHLRPPSRSTLMQLLNTSPGAR